MPRRLSEKLKMLAPALLVALTVPLILSLPQGEEQEGVVSASSTSPTLTLDKGDRLNQTFLSTGETINGIVVFSPIVRLKGQAVAIKLYDQNDTLLATSRPRRAEYRHNLLAIWLDIEPLELTVKQPVRMEVTGLGNNPLPLFVNNEDTYQGGALQSTTITNPQADLSFSLVHPGATALGTKQGAIAGLVVLLGSVLIAMLPRYRWLAAAALLIITLPLATAGFWFSTDAWGQSDWDFFTPMHEGYRQTLVEYHQFPFWNPYTYGGVAGLGDPEFAVISFNFLFELLFGVITGFRLAIYTALIIAGLGTLALGKRLGLSVHAALLASIAFSLSAAVMHRFVEGHIQYFAIAWIPWIFLSWYAAYQQQSNSRRWNLLCGVFLALTFYQGGIYILFYILPALLLFSLLAKQPLRALRVTIVAGLWSFGLAAFKVLPVLAWIKEFPDDFYHVSSFSLPYWVDIYLRRHLHQATILPNQSGGWHEYGAYIGPVVLGLAAVSVSHMFRNRIVQVLLVGAAAAAVIATAGPALVPIFDIIPWLPRSNIVRLALFSVFSIALLAGFGLDILQKHSSKLGRYLVPALVGLVAIDLMSFAYPLSEQAFIVPPVTPPVAAAAHPIAFTADPRTIRIQGSDEERTYAAALAGFGTTFHRPNLAPPLNVTTADQPNSDYLTSSDPESIVQLTSWSPNKVQVKATVNRNTAITLNSNYAAGWQVNDSLAENHQGRLGTTVPAGDHSLTFRYRPRGYLTGLIITMLTVLLAGAWYVVPRWREIFAAAPQH